SPWTRRPPNGPPACTSCRWSCRWSASSASAPASGSSAAGKAACGYARLALMNFKTTYLFFGILVALLGVAALTLLTGPKPGSEGLLLANLKSADVTTAKVTRLTVERTPPAETTLGFGRGG